MEHKTCFRLVSVVMLARFFLGLMFIWAALSKMPRPWQFADEIAKFGLIPSSVAPAFAIVLIVVELLTGSFLILGFAVRWAAWTVVLLLAIFTLALSQALLRHLDLTCGCFGGDEPATWWTVARDLALLLGGIALLRNLRKTGSPQRGQPLRSEE